MPKSDADGVPLPELDDDDILSSYSILTLRDYKLTNAEKQKA